MTTRTFLENYFVGTATVGERGQVVIPAEIRKRLEIGTGDRLLVMQHPSQDGLMFFKVDAVREFLNHLAAGLNMAEQVEDKASDVGGKED